MAINPFEFVTDIQSTKNYIFDDVRESSYVPFIVNKALSFSPDTVILANYANEYAFLDKQMQHDLLWYGIRKRPKSFNKWPKKTAQNLNIVQQMYDCNEQQAAVIASILTEEQMAVLRQIEDTMNNAQRSTTNSRKSSRSKAS